MYGENAGLLRAELAVLLRQHRIQQRLGGPGTYRSPETTTIDQRQGLGAQIRRYRHTVLAWCLQAAEASVSPRVDLDGISGGAEPAAELRRRLTAAVDGCTAGRPTLEELTTHQEFAMVETWRQAARAAALGEHDFTTDVNSGHLDHRQCMTVLKDSAETTRALVGLDRRYSDIPGWQKIHGRGWLARTAQTCATFAGRCGPDYTVDHRGWHPPATVAEGPPKPGWGGIIQGEHELLVHLEQFPDAHSMRLVLDSQRIVSHEAALRAQGREPALATKWEARAETLTWLLHQSRDLRGRLGDGGAAVAHGAIVAARAQQLAPNQPADSDQTHRLDRLFARIDHRLAEIIEYGATQHLYVARVKLPRIDGHAGGVVRPVRERYVPIDEFVHGELARLVRTRLRPPPVQPRPPAGAGQSRADFEAALTHRPPRRTARDLGM